MLREVFKDPRLSLAMSIAMDRDETNEIVHFGQGRPANVLPVEPTAVGIVTDEKITRNTEIDPDRANALLGEMDLTMGSGGIRRLADGRPLGLRLTCGNQGGPVQMHELIRDCRGAVGVRIDLREVSSEGCSAGGTKNELDILTWKTDGVSAPAFSRDLRAVFPPFGDFFDPGPGIARDRWVRSEGADGIGPPEDILRPWYPAERLSQIPLGAPEADEIGAGIVEIHLAKVIRVGTAGDIPKPSMHHSTLQNVQPLTAKTHDFCWVFPYRPRQWFIAE